MPSPTAAVVSCFFLLLPPPTSSSVSSAGSTASATSGEALRVAGDVVLGGLFPMHEQNLSRREMPCGAIKEEKGIQRMEAMMYALDQINADAEVLRGIRLGAHILDTCSNPEYALEQSMRFVKLGDEQPCSSPTSSTYSRNASAPASVTGLPPVTGVIGAAFSGVSIMVANILRLFKIPQIREK